MYVSKNLVKNRSYLILTYVGVVTFFIGSTSAMFIKPGYSFTNQWLSDLGTGEYALLFNTTVILTGILTSTFYPLTFYLLRQQGYSRSNSAIGMIFGVTSFVFLILVGVFNLENDVNNFHSISTIIFLISASLSQILLLSGFSWYVCIHLASPGTMDYKLSYISLIMASLFGLMFVGGISYEQFLLQKMTVYLLVTTVLYQSLKVWQSDDLFKPTN